MENDLKVYLFEINKKVLHWVKALFEKNDQLSSECALINLKRIFYCAIVAIPVHTGHIILFATSNNNNAIEAQWRTGIITSHALLLICMILFLIISIQLMRHEKNIRIIGVLQYLTVSILLVAGIAIASIDQLVTTNITPYLVVCLIIGTVFLIHPIYTFFLFACSYMAFYLMIDINSEQAALLSNRVNGITFAALGFLLSFIMWHHNAVQHQQRLQIDNQRKELERMNRELEKMAFSDSLTGLPNRRFFDEAVDNELDSMKKRGHVSSLIEFDLDNFKKINDTFGHNGGDIVLREIGEIITNVGQNTATYCRYGGEEFIVLLTETSLDRAYDLAEELRTLLENHAFAFEDYVIRITASFGVTQLETGISKLSNYINADQALYLAKQNGRNRVEAFSQDQHR